jgi:RimJ/RimL family protein N-acetyltransferase
VGTVEILTERLLLRRWRLTDREPFAAMNADPEVMQHCPGLMTREQSDGFVDRIDRQWAEGGYGPWAVEVPGVLDFAGYVGLLSHASTRFDEIGWRLARPCWGRGYASEAGRAVLADAFERMGRDEIVSFTVPANVRSTAVMERIGMTHHPERDFDHPNLPAGHPLRRHVLYSITREEWRRGGDGHPAAW